LVCISLDFAEYLLEVQVHIAQSMHHVQLSSSDGILMKLHMIQWMIRRAKKADQVRERDIDTSVSLSVSLSLSLWNVNSISARLRMAGNNTQNHILGTVWIVYYLFTCLGHEV
jgi:hypothetical protein